MPLYVVDTIRTFRARYVIDCKELGHAFDTVAMEEAEEFSQMYLGEQIVTGRKIGNKKFAKMNKALEFYGDGTEYQPELGSPWMDDKMIHKVEY